MSLKARARRGLAFTLAAGLIIPGLAALAAAPAQAAPVSVDDVQFRWGFTNESNSRAFAPGTYNHFAAGKLGNPGAGGQTLSAAAQGATWANGAAAGWKATDGEVTIEKEQADGSYAATTWAGLSTAPDGTAITFTKFSDHQVVIDSGTGTLDAAADDASISWDGDFTVVYYSGMSFFYVSDPELTVDNGVGTVTATLSGYGSDMNDTGAWTELAPAEVTLATLSGVDVTETGLVVTPDYLGVEYEAPAGGTAQSRTGATWGAFPQSFVDYQVGVGSASYWYSSGGAADARKPTIPLEVVVPETQAAEPASVTVSRTSVPEAGQTTVTVEGTGFDPAAATGARPPLAGKPAGAYVAFGKVADVWRPSAGAPSTSRVNTSVNWAVLAEDTATVGGPEAGAIELRPDGTFTAELTVDKAAIDAKATDPALTGYGIYTYAGSGAVQATYETFTPITFTTAAASTLATTVQARPYGTASSIGVTVSPTATGTVTVTEGSTTRGSATLSEGRATVALPTNLAVGAHSLTVSYEGSSTVAASSKTVTLTVAKASSSVSTSVRNGSYGTSGSVTVAVRSAVSVGGSVTLKEGSKSYGTRTLSGGRTTFTLPKSLATGKHTFTATYNGSGTVAAATAKPVVSIAKASVGYRTSWTTKVKAGQRVGFKTVVVGKAGVAKPTGKVKVTFVRGKKSVVRWATIKSGVAKVSLTGAQSKRLGKGRWTIKISYTGNARYQAATGTRTVTAR
ncbi:Ig-like domain-containing protein [Nocardioides sp. NPDC057577]|uniref:Ig-like domain-containing protein n=1 Tax=Nocardioides sp. NPDC057577 TaxID=3346171 RepID=UPI00366E746B